MPIPTTPEKPFIIYRSSAGSGKTYTLALEYLTLALQQPTAYRKILAVTFTNKATQEMKSRIVNFLNQLANGQNEPLRQELERRTGLVNATLIEQAQHVLRQLLHGYSYFAVMTIDSFFQKVVRAFAREMDLQAGFSIEIDQGKVLEEVIDQLLLTLGEQSHRKLRQWLTRFAEEKVETGQTWDFRRDIKTLAYELFKEDYKQQQAQEGASSTVDMTVTLQQLRTQQQQFEQQMAQYGQQALTVMERYALTVDDFAHGKSGVAGYFLKLVDASGYEPGKRVLAAAGDATKWSSKSSQQREQIVTAAEDGLLTLLDEVLNYYQDRALVYYSCVELSRFVYTYGILNHLETQLQTYQRERDLMLISDAPLFLKDIIGQDDTPFIYEKIGTTYEHFLIDEFQDTSGLQWTNFRPLVENSLNAGHRNLVVGDVKQSIYRWRGGDWQLLLEKIQQDVADYQTEVRDLDRNYRSRRHIVDFNNALFTQLSELLYQTMVGRLNEDDVPDEGMRQFLLSRAEIVRHAYTQVGQQLPPDYRGDWHGHVRIQLLEKEQLVEEEEETHWKDYVKEQLPHMVETLQDQGYALQDIAFLVRNKREGREVAQTFMDYKHQGHARQGYRYEVISPESLFLNASLTVGLLVDVLRFLDNPTDRIARGSVVHKYRRIRQLPQDSPTLHRIFAAAGVDRRKTADEAEELAAFYKELPSDFQRFQDYLNKLPLYELVENLIRIFDLGVTSETVYLQAFQDAVLNFTRVEQGDLHSFLQWWDERGQETSVQVAEAVDAMRIMTIHKAKGLQFRVVILPFCTWDTDHHPSQTNILWTRTLTPPLQELGLMPMRYSKKLINTVFRQDYYEELIRVHIDNLNLLYVAFTRAEECLYAFAPPKGSKNGYSLDSVANALRQSFSSPSLSDKHIALDDHFDETDNVLELGVAPHTTQADYQKKTFSLTSYPSVRWRDRLMVRPTSHGYFNAVASNNSLTINLITLLRALLVRMEHAHELEQHLQDIYYERGITLAERERLQRHAEGTLKHPLLRKWYETEDTVKIQRTLLTGNQHYVCPDRVMIDDEQATVVHFGLADEQAEHTKVVKQSCAVLQQLGYTLVKGYWVNVQALEVVEV